MADLVLSVTYFGILLGLGILLANVLKKHNIPDSFFLLLLGLVLGPTLYTNPMIVEFISLELIDISVMGNIPDFLRILALIMVVFMGTFHLGLKSFKKVGNTAVNLAFVGVIFNTVILGLVITMLFGFDLVYSLLLGAVISGTGTSVVFAFEGALEKAKSALDVIKVESVLNSPLSVLLPIIFLDLVALEPGAILEPMRYLEQFWVMIAAGAGAGLIIGLGISRLIHGLLREYTPLMIFSIALITYALAENVGGSGMLAVGVCGVIAGNHLKRKGGNLADFENQLSELLRISVFTLLGAQVTLFIGIEQALAIFLLFIVMFFARPLYLIPTLGSKRKEYSRREFMILAFITPRGLSAAAMAPIVAGALIAAGATEIADQVLNIIFLIIMLSVAFSTLFAMLVKKGLREEEEPEREPEEEREEKEEKHPDEDYLSVDEKGPEPKKEEKPNPEESQFL